MGTFLFGKGFSPMYRHIISTTVSASTSPSGETPSHRFPFSSDVTHSPVLLNQGISLMYMAMAWSSHVDHHIIASFKSSFGFSPVLTSSA